MSYAGLHRQIIDWVGSMNRMGIGRRDRVALVLPAGARQLAAMLGTSAGATCVPFNPVLPEPEFGHLFEVLAPVLLIIGDKVGHGARQAARSRGIPVIDLSERCSAVAGGLSLPVVGRPAGTPARLSAEDDVILVLATSGSTALPRLVPLTRRNIDESLRNICDVLELSADDRMLCAMPLHHIHGASVAMATLRSGGTVLLADGAGPEAVARALVTQAPTWYSASPAVHRMVLDATAPAAARDTRLRFIRSASSPLDPVLQAELERVFNVPVIQAYGMTEAAPQIASNRLPPALRKPGSVGKAAGPEIRIVDGRGAALPAGVGGEIAIRGDNVFAGYIAAPNRDPTRFGDGWFRTGDLGYLDNEGYLFVTGRTRPVIDRGGEKISVPKVTRVVESHPAVIRADTRSAPHPVLGEEVAVSVVVRDEGGDTGDLAESIRVHASARLSHFELPARVTITDRVADGGPVPAPSTGQDQRQSSPGTLEWGNATERVIREIWAEVLDRPALGVEDNFFAVGGDSLRATQALTRIEERFSVSIALERFFEQPTIAALSTIVGREIADLVAGGVFCLTPSAPGDDRPSGASPLIPSSAAATSGASFGQQRLWFLDRLGAGAAYNMNASLTLRGALDSVALECAVNDLVRRHDTLRTVIRRTRAGIEQVVQPYSTSGIEFLDLSGEDPQAQQRTLDRLAREEAQRPFDLSTGPLFRCRLLRLGERRHVLLFIMHHAVSDGWSSTVLQRELAWFYRARSDAAQLPSLPPAARFTDYCADLRRWIDCADHRRQADYWKDRLRDMPVTTTFPLDRARPSIQGYRGSRHRQVLDAALASAANGFAAGQGTTLFVLLLSAFFTLVHRYSRQELCVVGIPVANRRRPNMDAAVGFYANTLAVPADLSGNPSFRRVLAMVGKAVAEAMAHQELPFAKLVEELDLPRNASHAPVFQLMFVMQAFPGAGVVAEGASALGSETPAEADAIEQGPVLVFDDSLSARRFPIDNGTAKFDLTLHVYPSRAGIVLSWQFNRDLFDSRTVGGIAARYREMLCTVINDPDIPIGDIRFQPDSGHLLSESSGPRSADPVLSSREPFLCRFRRQVERVPDNTAVIQGDDRVSYRELDSRADRLAAELSDADVRSGDLVAIDTARTMTTIVAILATWRCGAAWMPVDSDDPPGRVHTLVTGRGVRYRLTATDGPGPAASDARGGVGIARSAHRLPGAPGLVLERLSPSASTRQYEPGNREGDDAPAYVMYTSGSTGDPKPVTIGHADLGRYIGAMLATLGTTESDTWFHSAPFSFSASVRQFVLPLSVGATVVIGETGTVRDPLLVLQDLRRHRIAVLDLVPSRWRALLDSLRTNDRLGELLRCPLRLVLSASERLPVELAARLMEAFPHSRIVNMYGQTETCGIVCTHTVTAADLSMRSVPIGRPLPGIVLRVADENLGPVPEGAIGELCIGRGGSGESFDPAPPSAPSGDAEDGASASHDDGRCLHRTGDLVRLRSDGELEFIGRNDRQLKVRGIRVDPESIETVLRRHPRVVDAAVVAPTGKGAGSEKVSTTLAAYVVVAPRASAGAAPHEASATGEPDAEVVRDLRDLLRRTLPRYLVPAIVLVREVPRTRSGKPDPRGLAADGRRPRESAPGPESTDPQPGAPGSQAERTLATIWCHVLGVDRVATGDNFFDLGGDSLRSIEVVDQARLAGLDITLEKLFLHQRLGDLARAAANQPSAPSGPAADTRPAPAKVVVAVDSLRDYGREALQRAGLDPAGAAIVTEVQLEASLRGQPTHDMVSIPRYARRIAAGLINPRPDIRVESQTPVSARIDGDNGPGAWIAVTAMETAIRLCRSSGIGMVAVRRSNHFGAAGHYAWLAGLEGFVGLCTTNGPVLLAPTGGLTPTFGNNPLAVCIPAATHPPILMDVAMSVAPRGRIGLQLAEGESLPPGWILDSRGEPSVDPADLAAGLGVPIGGHKGYALALVMEVLAGVLTGAGFGRDHARSQVRQTAAAPDVGHFLLAIDPARFLPGDEFTARVDRLIEQTKASALMDGVDEILVPGERELRTRARSLAQGVTLRRSTFDYLCRYGTEAGLVSVLESIG